MQRVVISLARIVPLMQIHNQTDCYAEVMMKTGNRLFSLATVTALILLAAVTVCGDTIRLKNGSIIKGKVISFNQQEFTVILDLGSSTRRSATRMTIAVDDVESIEFDGAEAAQSSGSSASAAQPPAGKYGEAQRESSAPVRTSTPPPDPTPETSSAPTAATPEPAGQTAPGGSTVTGATIEKTVSVPATADWTSTEIRVQRGQRISITASGEVDLGGGQRSTPGGISTPDTRKLIQGKPTGALIAVVGDDNDDFVFIGRSGEFTAAHSGILFLSVNEGNLKDNAGAYLARVKILGNK